MRDIADELKNTVTIDQVAEGLGLKLRRNGSNMQGDCPSGHSSDHHHCFSLDLEKNFYHCFSCGIGGDIFNLVNLVKKTEFKDSLIWLVDNFRPDLRLELDKSKDKERKTQKPEYYLNSELYETIVAWGKELLYKDIGKKCLEYLIEERGYNKENLKATEWFYLPRDAEIRRYLYSKYPEAKEKIKKLSLHGRTGDKFRLAFPYRDHYGVITGFIKRATAPQGIEINGEKVRWDSNKGVKKDDPFNLYNCKGYKDLVIVEGYPDALYFSTLGLPNIVAVGQGLLTQKHIEGLKTFGVERVIIAFDNDPPKESGERTGVKNTKRAIDLLAKTGIKVFVINPLSLGEEYKDPDELVKAKGIGAFKSLVEKARDGLEWRLKHIIAKFDLEKDQDKDRALGKALNFYKVISDPIDKEDILKAIGKQFGYTLEALKEKLRGKKVREDKQAKPRELPIDYLKYCESKTFTPPILAKEIMNEYRFLNTAGALWYYKDGVYIEGGEKLVKALCREKLDNQSRQHRTAEVIFDIQVATQLEEAELNSDPYILNLENGLLDIRKLELKDHTPDYYSTVQIPIRYDPIAKCSKIDQFFSEVMPEDCIPLAYEIFGYCLLPLTPYHNAIMLVGDGRNGKSTFLDLLSLFLGKENTSNIPLQDLSDNRFKRADLFGKLANVFADLDSRSLKSTSYFKTIVGGDRIDAERKHQDPFYFEPFAKLLFSTNAMPKSRDRSYAYYKRWIIIPFPNQFIKGSKNYNPNILEEISTPEELSGLLNKAIKGLKSLKRDKGFIEPQSTQETLEDYMISNDNVLLFVNECCTIGKEVKSGRTEVFKRYRGYCEESNLKPVSQRVFNKRIEGLGVVKDRAPDPKTRNQIWRGLGLKN